MKTKKFSDNITGIIVIGIIIFTSVSYQLYSYFKVDRSFTIHRAIVASDTNPMYLDFWPIIAKAWTRLGIKPTLALIADDEVEIDESLGDVIRFKPIPGVSTALYSQAIRLLLPLYFKDEYCLLSDIDMIPISRSYFIESVKNIPANSFGVYRDKAYSPKAKQYPICYNAAKGSTFSELLGVEKVEEIPAVITQWSRLGLGWMTDELLLYNYLQNWKDKDSRVVMLGDKDRLNKGGRIDRGDWQYDKERLVADDFYIDSHSVRPYSMYKKEVDELVALLESKIY